MTRYRVWILQLLPRFLVVAISQYSVNNTLRTIVVDMEYDYPWLEDTKQVPYIAILQIDHYKCGLDEMFHSLFLQLFYDFLLLNLRKEFTKTAF